MPKFFVKNNQIDDNQIKIMGEDVNHISNVLRMKNNEAVQICDIETSQNYSAKIIEQNKQNIVCEILEKIESKAETKINVHIFQGLPKSDKMELIIQKSTELGVKEITPVQMERCVVKLDKKDSVKKIQRWQKIAEVAAKQSGRDIIPKINNVINSKEFCKNFIDYDIIIIAYENEKVNTIKPLLQELKIKNKYPKIAILIGPEGGIEDKEMMLFKENNAKIVTLGNRILRTETVALNMLSVIIYEFEGDVL